MPWSPRLDAGEWFYGFHTEWRRALKAATPAEATRSIIAAHAADLKSEPTRSLFWLLLAHHQCRDNCLQPAVKRKALAIIRRGPDRIMWLNPGSRAKDFERLRGELTRARPRRPASAPQGRAKVARGAAAQRPAPGRRRK